MKTVYRSTRSIDEASVDATPVFTEFGDSVAGFCDAEVCAIPPVSLSDEPDLVADPELASTSH